MTFEQELELIRRLLEACGAPPEHAYTQALWLAEADLRGHRSHGIQRVPVLVGRIRAGLLRPAARPEFEWRSPSALVVEGGRGFGPVVGTATVDELMSGAGRTGIAVGAVAGANHLGLLAMYVQRIASEGLIGIATTTSEALVHAWGGSRPMIGTNPLAVGIPTGGEPFILDMATGAVSMGKVIAHSIANTPLEPGWAIDRDGAPTVSARAALDGAISPFGGPKGYGLGLALQLLVAGLTGTSLGTAVHGTLDTQHPASKGDLFMVLDPQVFGRGEDDIGATADYLEAVRDSAAPEARRRVAIPGDRSRSARQEGLLAGFDVDGEVWGEVCDLLKLTAG